MCEIPEEEENVKVKKSFIIPKAHNNIENEQISSTLTRIVHVILISYFLVVFFFGSCQTLVVVLFIFVRK
jgi:hypothetical protein